MDGFLTRFLAGEIFSDPLVSKLFLLIIFFLGASQAVRIIHGFWKTGQVKTQEKQVEEEKGQWKVIVDQLVQVIVKLSESIEKQTEIMGKISEELRDQKYTLKRVEDKVSSQR